jgi:hypothetical protein
MSAATSLLPGQGELLVPRQERRSQVGRHPGGLHCHRGIHRLLQEDDKDNRYFDTYQDTYEKLVGTNDQYNRETKKWHVHPDSPEPGLWEAHRDLNQAIESGAYDEALFNLFGDHAIVRIRKGSNIVVTEYSHD